MAERGTCWSELVKQFPGRTSLAIKNRWNSMKRKEERQAAKGEMPAILAPPPLQITALPDAPPELPASSTAEEIPIATATVAAISDVPAKHSHADNGGGEKHRVEKEGEGEEGGAERGEGVQPERCVSEEKPEREEGEPSEVAPP